MLKPQWRSAVGRLDICREENVARTRVNVWLAVCRKGMCTLEAEYKYIYILIRCAQPNIKNLYSFLCETEDKYV